MKNKIFTGLVVSLLIFTSICSAQVSDMSTPYFCSSCTSYYRTEALFGDHIAEYHNIDIQIKGDLPVFREEIISDVGEKKYIPVKYYLCPDTGQGFFTENQLCMHLDNL